MQGLLRVRHDADRILQTGQALARLERGNLGSNGTTHRPGTRKRKDHMPEVYIGSGELDGHVPLSIARTPDGHYFPFGFFAGVLIFKLKDFAQRSEERRVGKECRSRWSPYH